MTEIERLQQALASSKQSGKSPLVEAYEAALAAYFGARHALAVNSGSAAIQTALRALGAAPGRKVIVSAAAPLPSLLPVAATGAQIVFADSRADSPALDPGAVADALDDEVAAVLEVPLWGYPQDYTALQAVLARWDIPLVEDAAQAHGAMLGGRAVGTLAAIGCFSTHEKKFLSTGEGGFLLTNQPELHERMKQYARLGHLSGAAPGMNFKISAFTAAIGLSRLEQLDAVLARRRGVRAALLAALDLPEMAHVGQPNGYNLVLDVKDADEGLHHRLAQEGIETDALKYGYKCGYQHRLFAGAAAHCPQAEALLQRLIQLPTDIADPAALASRVLRAMRAAR